MDTGYSKSAATFISENSNYYPDERELVANELNQNANLNGGRTNNIISGTSANLTVNMTSTSEWLTPVIDSERISLCCTTNKISNYTRSTFNTASLDDREVSNATGAMTFNTSGTITSSITAVKEEFLTLDIGKEITISGTSSNNSTFTVTDISSDGGTVTISPSPFSETTSSAVIVQHERYLDGIAPTGTSNAANYMTKRFTVENPATALKILFEMNRPDQLHN